MSNDPHDKEFHVEDQAAEHPRAGRWTLLLFVAGLAVAGVIVGVALNGIATFGARDVVIGDEEVGFEVLPGDTAFAVLERLIEGRIVVDDLAWNTWIRVRQPGGCLQAGMHTLPGTATPGELFEALCETAYAAGIRVTIPEGTNRWQLADRLSEAGLGDRDAFVDATASTELVARFAPGAPTLEGYLAPDTYEYATDATPTDIVRRLAEHGAATRAELWESHPAAGPAEGYDLHQLLTVASIVEEEARVADERPLIARVIYNRLARGMQLQCDPTCVYGPDIYQQTPTRALCRDPASTHSTYVLPGLPPTPITNPGRAAIAAALQPADDPDVLYFAAIDDGSGRHAFADTLEAHNRNVDRYVRGR